jgi:hypothetical protein
MTPGMDSAFLVVAEFNQPWVITRSNDSLDGRRRVGAPREKRFRTISTENKKSLGFSLDGANVVRSSA